MAIKFFKLKCSKFFTLINNFPLYHLSSQENKIQEVGELLYSHANKSRLQPCRESLKDETRYFLYDLRLATEHSNHTVPLLQSRHNIVPGMALVSPPYIPHIIQTIIYI